MAKKISDRRDRIRKANHGARPASGQKKNHLKGSGHK